MASSNTAHSNPTVSALHACSLALSNANGNLHASLQTLNHALSDHPRAIRVLQPSRQFELVSEDEVRAAQLEVQREVEPQIKELIKRAEDGLQALQKRERKLNEQVENRKNAPPPPSAAPLRATRQAAPSAEKSKQIATARARLMAIQTQKEALHKGADRAELDAVNKRALLET